MNNVTLIGRLTRDPDVRQTSDGGYMASMTIAIDRPPNRNGEKQADFPRVICFGRQAENAEKYLFKGRLVGITGSIQTGSYEKDGQKVYTTDVVARNIEYLEKGTTGGEERHERGFSRRESSMTDDSYYY